MYKGNLINYSVRKHKEMHLLKTIPIGLGYQLQTQV